MSSISLWDSSRAGLRDVQKEHSQFGMSSPTMGRRFSLEIDNSSPEDCQIDYECVGYSADMESLIVELIVFQEETRERYRSTLSRRLQAEHSLCDSPESYIMASDLKRKRYGAAMPHDKCHGCFLSYFGSHGCASNSMRSAMGEKGLDP